MFGGIAGNIREYRRKPGRVFMTVREEFQNITADVVNKAGRNKRIRRRLPGGGKISMDKAAPYLLVYRHTEQGDEREMVKLILTEASYLILPAGEEYLEQYRKLIRDLTETGTEKFGSFLLLELWEGPPASYSFVIKGPDGPAHSTVDTLLHELQQMRDQSYQIEVKCEKTSHRHPQGTSPLLEVNDLKSRGGLLLGLEIPPVFQNPETGKLYPVLFRKLRQRLSEILRKALFDFIRVQTTFDAESYRVLGRRYIDNAVWHIDKKLAEIEQSYQFLLLLSPMNADREWENFRKKNYRELPKFTYRLLPVDPEILKKELYNLDLNKIYDPALAYLFRDKRNELDIQVTMLAERGNRNFLYNSIRLYKGVEVTLYNVALGLLSTIPSGESEEEAPEGVGAEAFARRAREEFGYYRSIYNGFNSKIEIRDDITGLMVSQGNLYIPRNKTIRRERVEALIHHEVGTHVLTYCNGKAQPFKQLYCGLADYDELQEGLAVFAEYLAGGLDRARMRLLAARVVAAHALINGADFIETFHLLVNNHGMTKAESWYITARVYQCGGFIKDIIYLRGLVRLIDHLKNGGELEPLFIGKIADKHIPLIKELREREVLRKAPLMPRYLKTEEARKRVQEVRDGLMLPNMISN